MIPIKDSNPTRRTPIMNLLLIGVNVLVFIFELGMSERQLDQFMFNWGVLPQEMLLAIGHPFAAGSLHAFETLITSQFIHAGWLHIIFNMLFLWIFGDNIEDVMGSLLYLFFYLLCGIAAGLAQVFVLIPFLGNMDVPSIGASGAIAGVLGAYVILYPTARVRVLIPIVILITTFEVPAFVMLGIWFLEQFFSGVTSLTPAAAQTGGVAFWAHIGGFVAGMLMILPFWTKAREMGPRRVARYSPPYDR